MSEKIKGWVLIMRCIITLGVIVFTLVWFLSLFHVIVPKDNAAIIDFASGAILTQGWNVIIKWWFPSDIGSERKTELLAKASPVDESVGNNPGDPK